MDALLEFEEIRIDRIKKRWRLYFLLVMNDLEDPTKKIVTVVPHLPIKLIPSNNNVFTFGGEDPESEGMFVLKRKLPDDRLLSVSVFVFHSREKIKNTGTILKALTDAGGEEIDVIKDLVTTAAAPWVKLSIEVAAQLGTILEKISDRYFGFASLDEHFGPKYDTGGERDSIRIIGNTELAYSWRIIP